MPKPKPNPMNLVVNDAFIEIISELLSFFKGDIKKSRWWLVTSNPAFGGIPPLKLIMMGRGQKVLDFILNQKAENLPGPPPAAYEAARAASAGNTPPEGFDLIDGKLVKVEPAREWTIGWNLPEVEGRNGDPFIQGPTFLGTLRVREILEEPFPC